jgi:hypothetical protein
LIDHAFYSVPPCVVEVYSWQFGKYVETSWIAPEAKKSGAVRKLVRMNTLEGRAERSEGCVYRLRVGGIGLYEDVNIPRIAGLGLKNDGVTADNEVFNAMGMEGGQKVFVILVHPAPFPNPSVTMRPEPSLPQRPIVPGRVGPANIDIRLPSFHRSWCICGLSGPFDFISEDRAHRGNCCRDGRLY